MRTIAVMTGGGDCQDSTPFGQSRFATILWLFSSAFTMAEGLVGPLMLTFEHTRLLRVVAHPGFLQSHRPLALCRPRRVGPRDRRADLSRLPQAGVVALIVIGGVDQRHNEFAVVTTVIGVPRRSTTTCTALTTQSAFRRA